MTPALRKAFDEHRNDRAQELYEIASILVDSGITPDSEPILEAARQCRLAPKPVPVGEGNPGRQYWGFDLVDLRVNVDDQRHLRPRSAIMKGCSGLLSVRVQEYVPDDLAAIGRSYELLREAYVDFHLDAFQEIAGERHDLRAAWHMDTHLYPDTNSHGVHPRFHFQFGGERFETVDPHIRGVLLPEVPRLPCAPLDAILAVDFVLSHYCGDQWELLRDYSPSYLRLRKMPMQRYWSPYFKVLAAGIDNLDSIPSGGDACSLIPSIVVE